MRALIYFYSAKDVPAKVMTKIMEMLFGKIQKSNYGKYEYEVKGILPMKEYIRPVRAVIIVKKRHRENVEELFDEHGMDYRVFEIILKEGDFKKDRFF